MMDVYTYHLQKVKRFLSHYWNVLRGVGGTAQLSDGEVLDILANWEIEKINSIRTLWGGSSSNWIVKTPVGKYVLRNAGTNRAYIDFQILIINELAKQGFPYSIPQFLPVNDTYYTKFQDHFWLLYEFVTGNPLKAISGVEQAYHIGQVVAQFHKIARKIDDNSIHNFALALFETETVASNFQERVGLIGTNKRHTPADKLFLAHVNLFLKAIDKIPCSDKVTTKSLVSMPIYDDWHGHNIVSAKGKIVGLIEFDSLVTAPRIVDIQNALLDVAGTKQGVDIRQLPAFIQGYTAVLPLSKLELSLVYSLMIDRITAIISDILSEKKAKGSRHRDGVLIFLITLLNWIIKNGKEFNKNLLAVDGAEH